MKDVSNARELTTNVFSKSEQLSDRELGTSDTANNRPFVFILDGPGHNIGEVLHCGEGDTVIIASLKRESSAFVEVDLGFKSTKVFG